MAWIITVIQGGIVGWLASIIARTNTKCGVQANVLVGMLGALFGRWLAAVMGLPTSDIMTWFVSILTSVLMLVILHAFEVFD
jgi:uncharacterized membrane protein YeaQ/YmgE (transglycosylase-associated protein family)